MTHVLIKRRNLNTNMYKDRAPCEDEGIYWGDVSISQKISKIVNKSPEARGNFWNSFPCSLQKEQTLLTY